VLSGACVSFASGSGIQAKEVRKSTAIKCQATQGRRIQARPVFRMQSGEVMTQNLR
jgi:hypothetical protein